MAGSSDIPLEAVRDRGRVEETVSDYVRITRRLASVEPPVNVWVDLSNLGLDISREVCMHGMERIIENLRGGSLLQIRAHDSKRSRSAAASERIEGIMSPNAPVSGIAVA